MFSGSDRPIEIAMTHRMGVGGVAERLVRPDTVRESADRVQRWTGVPEVCKSCSRGYAVRLSSGMALCARCHTQRMQRLGGVLIDRAGVAPVVRSESEPSETQLQGYAIRFNEASVDMGFIEFIRPAAGDRMIAEETDLRALWDHDSSIPLGRISAGTLRVAKRTAGIWSEIDPPSWATGQVESVSRRDVTGMSFAFRTLEDDWWIEEGYPRREILDMDVSEVSGVTFPAYPTTTLRAVQGSARFSIQRERQTAERLRMAR